MENLDRLCAEYGHEFAHNVSKAPNLDAKKAENLLTKALGVLQEQGLYSFVLFCKSRGSTERAGAEQVEQITTKLLKDNRLKPDIITSDDLLKELREEHGLASRFEDLILAIQVLEKSLIYARYHAKAMSKSSAQIASPGEKAT